MMSENEDEGTEAYANNNSMLCSVYIFHIL